MQTTKVDTLEWIKEGVELYKDNFFIVFICGAITAVVSLLSFGILAAPMVAAYYRILSRIHLKNEPAPEIEDMFKGFDAFLQTFLLLITVWVITIIGMSILNIFPLSGVTTYIFSLALSTVAFLALPLIAIKGLDALPAAQKALETVKPKFPEFLGFCFASSLVASIGVLIFGLGIFLTLPIAPCAIIIAYHNIFDISASEIEPAVEI